MFGRVTEALVARNFLALLAMAVLGALLVPGAWQFEINASADTLLTHENEKYIRSKATTERFSPEEFLLVAYEPVERKLLSGRTFGELRELSRRIGEIERVASVRSILNVPLLTLADGGSLTGLDAGALTVNSADYDPATVASALRDHPIYEGLLIDPEQTVTALQVLFRADPELRKLERRITELESEGLDAKLSEKQQRELEQLREQAAPLQKKLTETRNREVESVRDIVADYEGGTNIYLGGVHVLGHELIRIVRSDLVVFGATIAAVVAVLLLLLFREFRWVLIAAACSAYTIGTTIGLFGFLGLKATVVSANFVALQLILTLAVVVHLIVQYRELARANPRWNHGRLIVETMRAKTSPCLAAGVTTVVGFAALLVSGFQPVITFGWMMIVATVVTVLATLALFPVLLSMFGDRSEETEPAVINSCLGRWANFSASRGGAIATGVAAIVIACVVGFFRLDVDNSFIDYFADDTDAHRELTFIDKQLGGSTPLDLVYPVQAPGGDLLLNAEQLMDMQKLNVLFDEHEAVGKILSLENFTALAREVNDGKPVTEYEMTAAYRVMDRDIRQSLLGSFYAPDTREVRFSMRVRDSTPELDRSALLETLRTDTRAVLGEEAEFRLTNLFVLYEDILARLFEAQMSTLAVVLVALFLAFLAIFRSLRVALVVIVPNVLVTATVFGAMGWLAIPLDLMTITIAAVAMGIAVDDTIHYTHRYRAELAGGAADAALTTTHQSVGYAVLYTTLIIAAGFASLMFSDFVPSILFGLLTAVAMLAAVIYDLTVLPALLARFERPQNDGSRS